MRTFLTAALLLAAGHAQATTSFEAATNTLILDSVVVDGVQYNNVAVKIKGFDLLAVGSSQPAATTACAYNFSLAQFDGIVAGMTLEQVRQIMGCDAAEAASGGASQVTRTWVSSNKLHRITVYFDASGQTVLNNGSQFKTRSGF